MLRMFKHLRTKDWLYMLISLAFIIGQVWLDLKLPDYMSQVVTLAQTPGSDLGELLTEGGAMLACALGSLLFAFIVGYFVAKIAAGLSMRLREKVFHKTVGFSMEEVGRFSTASLITRSTNDITQIQTFVAMGLQALVKAPITAVWAIVKIAGKKLGLDDDDRGGGGRSGGVPGCYFGPCRLQIHQGPAVHRRSQPYRKRKSDRDPGRPCLQCRAVPAAEI